MTQSVFRAYSRHPHVIHDVTCLKFGCFFALSSSSLSCASTFSFRLFVLCPLINFHVARTAGGKNPLHSRIMKSVVPLRKTTVSQVVSPSSSTPKFFDDFHHSETSAMIIQDAFVDNDTELSYSCYAELDDELIQKAPSSPLFTLTKKFVTSSVPFHTHKNGKTRFRTQFVPKTKVQSRHGIRKNHDSP